MASSVMRMISGTAVFVGEYSELLEVRVVGIISYLLDIICLGLFVFYFTAVIRENFADFLTICLGGLCGKSYFSIIFRQIEKPSMMSPFYRRRIHYLLVHVHSGDL